MAWGYLSGRVCGFLPANVVAVQGCQGRPLGHHPATVNLPRPARPPLPMHWIAPATRDTANDALEKRLWDAADQFRANSGLTAAQYSAPVLGLDF